MSATQSHTKPVPIPDAASAPFFDGAREGKLMLLHCKACDIHMWPVTRFGTTVISRCTNCLSGEVEWAPASGRGELFTFALMYQPYDPAFEVPYNLSVVELEEGVRTTTVSVVDCANEDLRIGMPLEVVFEEIGDGVCLPMFKPAS